MGLVSRNAMMQGLLGMEGESDQVLPFVKGSVHHILQREGGEQRDPLMPMFFNLGQQRH